MRAFREASAIHARRWSDTWHIDAAVHWSGLEAPYAPHEASPGAAAGAHSFHAPGTEHESQGAAAAAAATTPTYAEQEPNDSVATAMRLDRSHFAVAENQDLWDDSLASLTINGAISSLSDKDFFAVHLEKGEQIWIKYKSSNPEWTGRTSNIVIYDTKGVAHTGANQSFEATVAGTYYVMLQAPTGGTQPPVGPIVGSENSTPYVTHFSIKPAMDQDLKGMLSGSKWKTELVSYSFWTESVMDGFQPFAPRERASTASIFAGVSSFADLTFAEAATHDGGDIRLGLHKMNNGGYANYPNNGGHSDVWVNAGADDSPYGQPGGYLYYVLLHEIGHALGLKHGHEEPAVRPEHDGHEFSLMSYRSYVGGPTSNTNGPNQFPQSFMMLDIAALQYMYGPSYGANAGDNVYRWNPQTGEMSIDGAGQGAPAANYIFRTIWDGGGDDTYDLSNYGSGVTVDLRPGGWSTLSQAQLATLGQGSNPPVLARGNVFNALLYMDDPRSLIENAVGGAGHDGITGNQAANRLYGGGGNDQLFGREGDDLLDGGAGNDTIDGGAGTDTVSYASASAGVTVSLAVQGAQNSGGAGTDTLTDVENILGSAYGDTLTGNAGANRIEGGGGADSLDGGAGADRFVYRDTSDSTSAAMDTIHSFDRGIDAIDLSLLGETSVTLHHLTDAGTGAAYTRVEVATKTGMAAIRVAGHIGLSDLVYTPAGGGTPGDDVLDGTPGPDALKGGGGNDTIRGLGGDDSLSGEAGDDLIEGGGGADTLDGGAGADRFVYRAFADSTSGVVDAVRNFETGVDRIDLTALGPVLIRWTESAGADGAAVTMLSATGRAGASLIRIEGRIAAGDILADRGIAGTGGDDLLDGTAAADLFDGAGGDDVLNGRGGDDDLFGGDGIDTAVFAGNRADYDIQTGARVTVRDLKSADGDEGTDTLDGIERLRFADMTVWLGTRPNHAPLLGDPDMIDQTWADGVAARYTIPETSFIDLDGAETLTYFAALADGSALPAWLSFDAATRTFRGTPPVSAIGATLTIRVTATDGFASVSDEVAIAVSQSRGADVIGTDGADLLEGTFRSETLFGGGGDDVLRGSAGADRLDGHAGIDEADYSASPGGVTINLANGRAAGGDAEGDELLSIERVTGSAFADRIVAGGDVNRIDGGAGADWMEGGDGDDVYIVDDAGDAVIELAGGGTDEVRTALSSYVLAAHVERLTGTSSAGQALTGNALANHISGGDGDDVIDGGAGADAMHGGAGNDVFIVDDLLDSVVGGAGTDTIRTQLAAYALDNALGVENLTGNAATGQALTGNASANRIEGGGGNDVIEGGAGADAMHGGGGGDLYFVDDGGDTVTEKAGEGTDEVRTALASYTLTANVELLTGTGSGQTLAGNDLANTIRAGGGDDTLYGGGGDDQLFGGAGNDAFNGGAGNDTIDGGTGADIMGGLAGDDLFLVDDAGDRTIEAAGEGTDEVRTGLASYALEANVENLTGTAATGQALTGNDLGNLIIGGMGDDVIYGLGGDDIIVGFAGADVLRGGGGNDVYAIDAADTVIELDGDGIDEIRTVGAIYVLGVGLENLRATSDVGHDFRGNSSANAIIGGDGNDIIRLQDGGDDVAYGKNGVDSFYFGGSFDGYDFVDGGASRDSLLLQGNYDVTLVYLPTGRSSIVNVEGISLVSGSNPSFGDTAGRQYSYKLKMVDENVLAGGLMKVNGFTLQAGENFTLDASAETDAALQILGGLGTDTLTGGAQGDAFVFGHDGRFAAGDKVVGGGGYDVVYLRGDYTVDFNAAGFAGALTGVESIALLTSSNTEFLAGGDGDFDYSLTWADDMLAAGGTFTVNGSRLQSFETFVFDGSAETNGTLRVFGGNGGDTLKGGAGNDQISGGGGADQLTGGAGADLFRFLLASDSTTAAFDTVTDFVAGQDKIDVGRIDAKASTPDNEAFAFIGSAAFSASGPAASGELRAVAIGGGLWRIEADVDGDGRGDFFLEVNVVGAQPLTAADFVV